MNEKQAKRMRRMKRILDTLGMQYSEKNISWAAKIEAVERLESGRLPSTELVERYSKVFPS